MKALPVASMLLPPEGEILALVKPLFEIESREARLTGELHDPRLLVIPLQRVIDAGGTCILTV